MQKTLIALTIAAVATLTALAPTSSVRAQKGVPAEVMKELVPTGKLRAGINTGNSVLAQKSAAGELGGISVDLARALGKQLGVPVELVEFKAAGESFAAMASGKLDIAFFAIEPKRAAEVAFSPPYAIIDGAYMVLKDSPLQTPADVDRPGIRVGVGLGSAYDLYLTRTLKHATIIRAKVGGGQATIDLFYSAKPDAAAGVRQPLDEHARTNPNVRVMKEPFQAIEQAMGVPPGRPAAARYVRDFVEEMKKNGFVAAGLKRSGQSPDLVAPPATK
jgi:polar amino acid transport system substrate-binding protein